jgi:serine/threonine-protein kinase GIN4
MRGKWLGIWKMSKGAEKMLRRMIQPNADLRCTAPEVLQDPYWDASLPAPGHKKLASSVTPDKSKSYNGVSPLSSRRASKVQAEREQTKRKHYDKENSPITVPKSKKTPSRQRVLSGTDGLSMHFLLIADVNDPFLVLSLTKRRPNVNAHLLTPPRPRESRSALKQNSPKVHDKENVMAQQKAIPLKIPSARGLARKPSALGNRTTQIRNAENSWGGALDKSVSETDRSKGSVRDRMREWELERARLREMERVGESDTPDVEQDTERARLREMERVGESDTPDIEQETERHRPVRKRSRLGDIMPPVPPSPGIVSRSSSSRLHCNGYPQMHTLHRSGRVIPSHGLCLRDSSSKLITQLHRRHLCRLCQVCFITFVL